MRWSIQESSLCDGSAVYVEYGKPLSPQQNRVTLFFNPLCTVDVEDTRRYDFFSSFYYDSSGVRSDNANSDNCCSDHDRSLNSDVSVNILPIKAPLSLLKTTSSCRDGSHATVSSFFLSLSEYIPLCDVVLEKDYTVEESENALKRRLQSILEEDKANIDGDIESGDEMRRMNVPHCHLFSYSSFWKRIFNAKTEEQELRKFVRERIESARRFLLYFLSSKEERASFSFSFSSDESVSSFLSSSSHWLLWRWKRGESFTDVFHRNDSFSLETLIPSLCDKSQLGLQFARQQEVTTTIMMMIPITIGRNEAVVISTIVQFLSINYTAS